MSVESPPWNLYDKWQVCGLALWMNNLVCVFGVIILSKKSVEIVHVSVICLCFEIG